MKALSFAQHAGCRPGPEVFAALRVAEEYERIQIDDQYWVGFGSWAMRHVDAEFASCMGEALRSAVGQLRDPSLGLRHQVNGVESPFLSIGGIHTEDIDVFEQIAVWCEGGAFDVKWQPSYSVLSR